MASTLFCYVPRVRLVRGPSGEDGPTGPAGPPGPTGPSGALVHLATLTPAAFVPFNFSLPDQTHRIYKLFFHNVGRVLDRRTRLQLSEDGGDTFLASDFVGSHVSTGAEITLAAADADLGTFGGELTLFLPPVGVVEWTGQGRQLIGASTFSTRTWTGLRTTSSSVNYLRIDLHTREGVNGRISLYGVVS